MHLLLPAQTTEYHQHSSENLFHSLIKFEIYRKTDPQMAQDRGTLFLYLNTNVFLLSETHCVPIYWGKTAKLLGYSKLIGQQ